MNLSMIEIHIDILELSHNLFRCGRGKGYYDTYLQNLTETQVTHTLKYIGSVKCFKKPWVLFIEYSWARDLKTSARVVIP